MIGSGIVLEPGGIADLDDVMDVMEDSFDPAYGESWTAGQCASLLPMPGVWLTLARASAMKDGQPSGETVGFALARVVGDEAELLLLAVRPNCRNCGVGRLLLRHFETIAVARGAERLHLEVREENPAIALYSSFGFSEVGRRKSYYNGRDGQAYDALTLSRRLSS